MASSSSSTIPSGSADDDRSASILKFPSKDNGSESTLACPICYEAFHEPTSISINDVDDSRIQDGGCCHPQECVRIPGCDHEFCRECLRNHCRHAISIRKIPIECPAKASDQCLRTLPVAHVRALLLKQDMPSSIGEGIDSHGTPFDRGDLDALEMNSEGARATTIAHDALDTRSSLLSNRYGSLDGDCLLKLETCGLASAFQEHQRLLDWRAFERLHRLYLDMNLTPCTRCQELVVIRSTEKNNSQQEYISSAGNIKEQQCFDPITCLACGHSFCQIHGDAHLTMSCDEYLNEKRQPDEETRQSERIIRKFCKLCSHCEAPIYKASGCDHIICPSCHNDMCFKCGTHRYLEGESMVRNCRNCNQSFIDHRHIGRYRILLCIAMPFYLPFYLLHVAVVGALAVVSCGCCCCLGCGIQQKPQNANKSKETRDCSSTSKPSLEDEFVFRPRLGAHTVLNMVFLPFVDLFHQCGFSCCCTILKRSGQRNHSEDEIKLEDDEEHQIIQQKLTMSTTQDMDS